MAAQAAIHDKAMARSHMKCQRSGRVLRRHLSAAHEDDEPRQELVQKSIALA